MWICPCFPRHRQSCSRHQSSCCSLQLWNQTIGALTYFVSVSLCPELFGKKKKKVSNWHSTGVTFLTLRDWLCQVRVRFPQSRTEQYAQASTESQTLLRKTEKMLLYFAFLTQIRFEKKLEKQTLRGDVVKIIIIPWLWFSSHFQASRGPKKIPALWLNWY